MAEHFHGFGAKGIEVLVDLRVGHLRRLSVNAGDRRVEPLHTAPWVDDPAVVDDESVAPNVRLLSGDFFCAPFGRNDIEGGPTHGSTANSPWSFVGLAAQSEGGGVTARYELQVPVLGSRVFKELRVRDDHPFLYERHVFVGGEGAVPIATHAMTRVEGSAALSVSRKSFGLTPQTALEPDPERGTSVLAYPARFDDLRHVPTASGGWADLTSYPFAERNEDFVMLVEAPGQRLGWTALARHDRRDIFLSLKNPEELPFTFLWSSHGGRTYHPWNGRHRGVLGIEEARSWGGYGHRASTSANPFSRDGLPTALTLDPDGAVQVRSVIGGFGLPPGWDRVSDVTAGEGRLTLTGGDGGTLSLPFDDRFLDA